MAATLLSMAGASYAPPDLSRSVLVMIDCQREYADHALKLPNIANASAEAARVADVVRRAAGTVIHIRHAGKPGGAFDVEADRGEFLENCSPVGGELVISKTLPNAFAGTDLSVQLEAMVPETLILAGFMTHMCVSATARAALDLGFGPAVVVANACATRDLPSAIDPAQTIPAQDLHDAELAALADRFAFVVPDAAALTR